MSKVIFGKQSLILNAKIKTMKWIGLSGGLGTGKSTVTQLLRGLGWTVLDADQLAHEALMPHAETYKQVLQDFGQDLVGSDGNIDRKKLSLLVFGKPDQLEKLEKIVHPYVRARVKQEREKLSLNSDIKAVFYDVPLLFEKNMQKDFDEVWVVACTPEIQRRRLREGRGWSDEEINRRLQHQLPINQKVKMADVVIDNNGDKAELLKNLEAKILTRL